jgi:hypothetical protein
MSRGKMTISRFFKTVAVNPDEPRQPRTAAQDAVRAMAAAEAGADAADLALWSSVREKQWHDQPRHVDRSAGALEVVGGQKRARDAPVKFLTSVAFIHFTYATNSATYRPA